MAQYSLTSNVFGTVWKKGSGTDPVTLIKPLEDTSDTNEAWYTESETEANQECPAGFTVVPRPHTHP